MDDHTPAFSWILLSTRGKFLACGFARTYGEAYLDADERRRAFGFAQGNIEIGPTRAESCGSDTYYSRRFFEAS